MTSQVRRITVSLPREQIKSLKNVSKMLNRPVSNLVSELIGEAVTSFEELVVNRDIEGALQRVEDLHNYAISQIQAVKNVKHQ
jgi:predicted DNA-binding protein